MSGFRTTERRGFLASLGCAALTVALPRAAFAQRARPTIGILLVGGREPFAAHFLAGLRDLGYVDGQSVQLEWRSAAGRLPALSDLAAELVRLKVDLIVASETPAVHAAKRATADIPIVMAPAGDPLGTGLVASLARPEANITGLSAATAELAGKSIEIVREILPSMRKVAALADPGNPFSKPFLEQIHLAAQTARVAVHVANVRAPDAFEAAFAEIERERAEAVIVQPTLPRLRPIELALKHRLPSASGNRAFADGGGLLSYAASLADRHRNAAVYVDRILKGAKPADLPVQQPTRYELVINLRTAKALGLTPPPTLLARADEVIE